MPFLHVSAYEGYTILAVISEEEVLGDGHHVVLDAEIVDSYSQAEKWFNQQLNYRHGGISNGQENCPFHVCDIGQSYSNGMRS